MATELDFRLFWMLGSALFGAGGAFAAVRLTMNQLKQSVNRNAKEIEKSKNQIAIHNISISVIDVKLTSILDIMKENKIARENAQTEYLSRFRSLEGQLVRIDQKIINGVHEVPTDYSPKRE